jgi:hypothetical protein
MAGVLPWAHAHGKTLLALRASRQKGQGAEQEALVDRRRWLRHRLRPVDLWSSEVSEYAAGIHFGSGLAAESGHSGTLDIVVACAAIPVRDLRRFP